MIILHDYLFLMQTLSLTSQEQTQGGWSLVNIPVCQGEVFGSPVLR